MLRVSTCLLKKLDDDDDDGELVMTDVVGGDCRDGWCSSIQYNIHLLSVDRTQLNTRDVIYNATYINQKRARWAASGDFDSAAALLAMQSAVLVTAIPSVCLSVRPSVCHTLYKFTYLLIYLRWYPIQTNEGRIMWSSR